MTREAVVPEIGSRTRLFAVLGNPVSHSLSPAIQNAALRALGLDGVYVSLRCDPEDLPGLVRGIARGRGGGNVTLPHKELAAQVVEVPSERVLRTGACNTFWMEEGKIHGENTDVLGFQGAMASLLGRPGEGLRALLLGSGGAARGALLALLAGGVREVSIWNRSGDRAKRLVEEVADSRARAIEAPDEAGKGGLDLVVNATSLGLREGDPLPLQLERFPRRPEALLDLVYRPEETALVRRARELGIRAADGGEMLVQQGAEAFRLWWGVPPPVEAMRAALVRARTPEGPPAGGD